MSITAPNLWALTFGQPWIDPKELAASLEIEIAHDDLDYRTKLLIRDSLNALLEHWGSGRLSAWIKASRERKSLEKIWRSDFDEIGFPTLRQRLMDTLSPETILQFFRDLGSSLRIPTRITVGGSIALMLAGQLRRGTDDIDVVDELPVQIRDQHDLVNDLANTYGLRLAHFQSHYLPPGWTDRIHSLDVFDRLTVYLVDPYDIFLSKLFSARRKDLDDLRILAQQFEKSNIVERFRDSARSMMGEQRFAEQARRNWYILYGEPLPA
jgi:hypothetical protein